MIAFLRAETKTPEDQALITDLFERITLYDLKAGEPKAVKRADGKWNVTVPVEAKKFYANGKGEEKEAPLGELIEIGLFDAEPFERKDVIRIERQKVRSGKQVSASSQTRSRCMRVSTHTTSTSIETRETMSRR